MIDPSIQSVSNKKQYTKKALELTNAVRWGGLAFAILLTIASILLIANTIRLSLYARRREVEVMKLVGATDWFIRWPFVIEGIIVGAAGGMLAIGVLVVVKIALLDPLFAGWSVVSQIRTISFPLLVLVLLGASALLSAVGSGISLRRFLRV
jgi:cell division transport system permease protein